MELAARCLSPPSVAVWRPAQARLKARPAFVARDGRQGRPGRAAQARAGDGVITVARRFRIWRALLTPASPPRPNHSRDRPRDKRCDVPQ